MKFKKLAMILIASFTLMACGGGEDADLEVEELVRYTAIDGYLSNAEVYLDTNQDGIATADERVGTTDANGQIELEAKSRDYAVIIRVLQGQTADSDYDGQAARSYEMVAGSGQSVVTPFSTLAYLYQMTSNELIAELDADGSLALTEEILTADYVAMAQADNEAAMAAHILARSMALVLKELLTDNYDVDSTDSTNLKGRINLIREKVTLELNVASNIRDVRNMVVMLNSDNTTAIASTSDSHFFSQFAINDTGITQCDDAVNNVVACRDGDGNLTAGVVAGQDGLYGRDSNPALNTDTDGAAGFNFRKISAAGERLAANAADWHCVQDNITGLMWEVKTPSGSVDVMGGLRYTAYTYSWYNADGNTNGGDAGREGAGNCEAADCDTAQYVMAINQAALCTYTDWRLPTYEELSSIVDYSASPTIDTHYFPHTLKSFYWSSSPIADLVSNAWSVDFNHGRHYICSKSTYYPVRLVRAGQ